MAGLSRLTGVVFLMVTTSRKTVEKRVLKKRICLSLAFNRGTIISVNKTAHDLHILLKRIFNHTEKPITLVNINTLNNECLCNT